MVLAVLLAVASEAAGETLARTCRRICQDEVQACIDAGGKRTPCRRNLQRECRTRGVAACLDAGEEARKASGSALYPPVVLEAAALSPNLVALGWPDSNTREHGYSIERSMNGTAYVEIGQTVQNATSYNDPGRLADTQYYYRVRAFRVRRGKYEFSSYSTVASVRTPSHLSTTTTTAVPTTTTSSTTTTSTTLKPSTTTSSSSTTSPSTSSSTSSSTSTSTTLPNQPPVADAGPDRSGTAGVAVTFDASGSTDADGTVAAYWWQFGDGASTMVGTPSVAHVYGAIGTYTATLWVRDALGMWSLAPDTAVVAIGTGTTTTTVAPTTTTVVPTTSTTSSTSTSTSSSSSTSSSTTRPTTTSTSTSTTSTTAPNQPPQANAGPNQATQTLTPIAFNGSGSFDPDGTIVLASWTFGDGTSTPGLTATHSYAKAGTYTATLSVIDDDGALDTDTATITIANRPPVANAGANQSGGPGAPLTFNGSGSSDPDGTITSYTWNFGDGTTASGAVVSHAYGTSGTYTVTLTVRDDDNAQSSDTAVATVQALTSGTWGRGIGDVSSDSAYAVDVDDAGGIVAGGTFRGSVSVGGITLTSAGGADWYLVKYDANGTALWARAFGGTSDDAIEGLDVDGAGNVVVIGRIAGTANLGGANLTASGPSDIGVAKYRGSDGAHLWSKRFGGVYDDSGAAVVADAAGDVYLTGYFRGTIDFGGGVLRVPFTTDLDVFVAKLTSAGAHAWSKNFTNDGNDRGYAIAVDGQGGVFVVGAFSNMINFGGANLVSLNAMMDGFVAKLATATGAHVWSRQVGAPDGSEAVYGVAVDAAGNPAVCGYAIKSVDFGGGVLGALGGSDGFVASYRGTTGAHLWSRRLGGTANDYAHGVAVAPDGGIVVAGAFEGPASFGGTSLTPIGSSDVFVAKYSSSGAPVWARGMGGTSSDVGQEVAVAPTGHPVVVGYFYGTAVFGGSTVTSDGMADAFVTKLTP